MLGKAACIVETSSNHSGELPSRPAVNSETLLARLAEEERDRAALLRLEADRLDRRALELELYAQADAPSGKSGSQGAKLLLSPAEAGLLLGMSRQAVVEMCQRGDLQHGRTDAGYYQIPRKAVRDYVNDLGKTP